MAYQALYRVWRPQRFADLVGQETVTQTLKNALMTDSISHAYLFTGPRGTGKTSAAKILAKAVNCRFRQDGEPCNQCETCKAITAGRLGDVIEIDAASNNGVDEIRDIRDKAKYAPTVADYKVYIIDEVHMLSTGAFNALLKTLEEPPAHVIFILATTEVQKVPATIISRTQRFDFKRIAPDTIVDRMAYILNDMKVTFDDTALALIANAAAGGMRDALSILDQVLSFGDDHVTLANALTVTGSLSGDVLAQYLRTVNAGDTAQGLTIVQKSLAAGKDPNQFITNLLVYLRDLLLYRQDPKLARSYYATTDPDTFAELTKAMDDTRVYQMIDVLTTVQAQLRQTTHPDVYLDVLTVKLTTLKDKTAAAPAASEAAVPAQLAATVQTLQEQVAALQKQLAAGGTAGSAAAVPAAAPKRSAAPKTHTKVHVNLEQINQVLGQATRKALEHQQSLWGELLSMLDVAQRAVLHVGTKPVAASASAVVVSFDYPMMFARVAKDQVLREQIEADLKKLDGNDIAVYFVPKEEWPRIRKNYLVNHGPGKKKLPKDQSAPTAPTSTAASESAAATASATVDPVVAKAQELFGSFVEIDSGEPNSTAPQKQTEDGVKQNG
ncbi:MAG: DNA polymerase III subunit gamma/tau [Schleiferilactobacillus harbinensis]|jgi:DNA polymerase-3 subunit gamma/tau|nr:DNA polymerase III subunit gamma/tau [Schleiferilactobacillus harbinensis]MCI1912718.1 DNA polymerase III subunit gamma/tau [Schleiferilactobacillus harbinensis]